MQSSPATAPVPVWTPLADAARQLGLPRSLVLADVKAGRLPLRIACFGQKRMIKVATADLRAYLAKLQTPCAALAA
jgi:hypothetical protein